MTSRSPSDVAETVVRLALTGRLAEVREMASRPGTTATVRMPPQFTTATTLAAPADKVWPCLAQMGGHRAATRAVVRIRSARSPEPGIRPGVLRP